MFDGNDRVRSRHRSLEILRARRIARNVGALDPAHEFGALPIEALPHVVAGYEAAGGELAGSEATIVWNPIGRAVDEVESGYRADAITAVLAFARDGGSSSGRELGASSPVELTSR